MSHSFKKFIILDPQVRNALNGGSDFSISSTDYIATPECDVEPVDCPDCKGTGKYVGLYTVEECQSCSGTGASILF